MIPPMRFESNSEMTIEWWWPEVYAEMSRSDCLTWVMFQLGTMTDLKDQWWSLKVVPLKYTLINRALVGMRLSGAMLA